MSEDGKCTDLVVPDGEVVLLPLVLDVVLVVLVLYPKQEVEHAAALVLPEPVDPGREGRLDVERAQAGDGVGAAVQGDENQPSSSREGAREGRRGRREEGEQREEEGRTHRMTGWLAWNASPWFKGLPRGSVRSLNPLRRAWTRNRSASCSAVRPSRKRWYAGVRRSYAA